MLPDEGSGLTVVYSDSDDGTRQKRLIATSNLEFGRTWTIGSVSPIGPRRAACVVDGPRCARRSRRCAAIRASCSGICPPEFDGNP